MKKRFIAGAQCPECNEVDSLMLGESKGTKYFECVECGFIEKMGNSDDSKSDNQQHSNKKIDNLIQWVSIDSKD
ncbi:MAG: YheV family putative metal-binding protein [Gammaproteobacteria bacterium]|nr:YheV family putative metal-binding protein [Gammaproteobacteria bacterium]